ncbi:MAG TPA: hypothetical protein VG965_07370 [Patescibacteria group bacterium]|nr:hypothetical protein [Patescibacteria group bacterium]
MENNPNNKKINPKALLLIAVFFIIIVLIAFVSLLIPQRNTSPNQQALSPTPAQLPETVVVPTPAIQTPASVVVNRLGDVTLPKQLPSLPTKIKIYTLSQTQISPLKASDIARSLGFTGEGQTSSTTNGDALIFQQSDGNLVFYLTGGSIQYYPETNTASAVTTEQQALKIGIEAIKKFSPYVDTLIPNYSSKTYYVGNEDLRQVDSFASSNFIDLPFSDSVDSRIIYSQFGDSASAHVWISKSGGINRITVAVPPQLTGTVDKETLSVGDAEKQVAAGRGIISKYGDSDSGPLPTPEKTSLNEVELAYFRDSNNKTLYPIFVFSGTSTAGGSNYPITVYLPALKP